LRDEVAAPLFSIVGCPAASWAGVAARDQARGFQPGEMTWAAVERRVISAQPLRNHFRALTLLARSEEGTTEAMMLAHGFPIRLISELVDAGLATSERTQEGKRSVVRLRITDAGWRMLQT
jgi:hypothetical protein